MKKTSRVFKSTRALTVAAMLTAMSVAIGIFCKNFLNFDGGLFRITFENLPILLAGILYGPIPGALVGVATDLISYLLSSQAYPPNLIVTVGAAAVGAIAGLFSRYILRRRGRRQIILSCAAAHFVGSMLIKTAGLYQYYGILVLWRFPLYLGIAAVEISILCMLFSRRSFRRLVGYETEADKDTEASHDL